MNCPRCGAIVPENTPYCPLCGNPINPQASTVPPRPAAPVYVDLSDHTSEFSAEDVSNNKVYAILAYVFGWIGVIIGLLASHDSEYVKFHVRQSLKITVCNTLLGIIALILCWTIVVPFAALVCYIILFVVRIICFFRACSGNSYDAPIVGSFGFLK